MMQWFVKLLTIDNTWRKVIRTYYSIYCTVSFTSHDQIMWSHQRITWSHHMIRHHYTVSLPYTTLRWSLTWTDTFSHSYQIPSFSPKTVMTVWIQCNNVTISLQGYNHTVFISCVVLTSHKRKVVWLCENSAVTALYLLVVNKYTLTESVAL